MANMIVLSLVRFLHDAFTAIWIGGMFIQLSVVLPSVKNTLGKGPESKKLVDVIRTRLSKLAWVCIVGLLITGILLSNSSPLFTGFLVVSSTYNLLLTLKHLIIAVMVIIAFMRGFVLPRKMNPNNRTHQKINMLLLVVNVILGLGVLLVSGSLSAISTIELTSP